MLYCRSGDEVAVFTRVDPAELQALLTALGLGRLLSTTEVADGVENSTYFIEVAAVKNVAANTAAADSPVTDNCAVDSSATDSPASESPVSFVLTLLEAGNKQQVEFSSALARHLHQAGLPVPKLHSDAAGAVVHRLSNKPALLSTRMGGAHPQQVSAQHCRAIGEFLGAMHAAGENFPLRHNNLQGLPWAQATLKTLLASLPAAEQLSVGEQALLQAQIDRYRNLCERDDGLPFGPIHADLFKDNTLFGGDGSKGDELKAVIDFNSACSDYLLLDVAIAVNDWACDKRGELDPVLVRALLDAYQEQRPFTLGERQNWQDMLCFAATLFYLSRLLTQHLGSADLTQREDKDPSEYRQKLQHRLLGVVAIPPVSE